MYIDDLSGATEIVLRREHHHAPAPRPVRVSRSRSRRAAGVGRAAVGVMRLSRTVGAAITNRRELGPAESTIMLLGAAVLIAVSVLSIVAPTFVVIPFVVVCLWAAASLLVRTYKLHSRHRRQDKK